MTCLNTATGYVEEDAEAAETEGFGADSAVRVEGRAVVGLRRVG